MLATAKVLLRSPPREALQKKKEELHAEKYKSRLDRRITFDFAGRKVVEEEGTVQYDFEQVASSAMFTSSYYHSTIFLYSTFVPLIFSLQSVTFFRTQSCWSSSRTMPFLWLLRSRGEQRREALPIPIQETEADLFTQNQFVEGRNILVDLGGESI